MEFQAERKLRIEREYAQAAAERGKDGPLRGTGFETVGEVLSEVLDRGSRRRRDVKDLLDDLEVDPGGGYRKRSPTRSERLNRALEELNPSAFKVHMLIWTWRGAPARGTLPYFTIRSLEKFCNLTRPTVRVAMRELVRKGWIIRLAYNVHHKNTLYRLVPIRKIPAPIKKHRQVM